MIRLKDLLSEKISGDVKWVQKAYDFALGRKFPFTPSVGKLLNKGVRVKAFHVTSLEPDSLKRMDSLQGSKKSISCMTKIPSQTWLNLRGIHRNGALLHLEGTLIIKAKVDIMSEPDEQGRRWIHLNDQLGSSEAERLHLKWTNFLESDSEWAHCNIQVAVSHPGKERNDWFNKLIKRHVELAEKFAKNNSKSLLNIFTSKSIDDTWSEWDELLLNDIKLLDVIWDEDQVVNADNQNPWARVPATKKQVREVDSQLRSIVSGTATRVNSGKSDISADVAKWVKSRGGTINGLNNR